MKTNSHNVLFLFQKHCLLREEQDVSCFSYVNLFLSEIMQIIQCTPEEWWMDTVLRPSLSEALNVFVHVNDWPSAKYNLDFLKKIIE